MGGGRQDLSERSVAEKVLLEVNTLHSKLYALHSTLYTLNALVKLYTLAAGTGREEGSQGSPSGTGMCSGYEAGSNSRLIDNPRLESDKEEEKAVLGRGERSRRSPPEIGQPAPRTAPLPARPARIALGSCYIQKGSGQGLDAF